jgi:predicted phosphodiesterase
MVGCSAYPRAVEVWNLLHDRAIHWVMGNEEERILSFFDPSSDPYLKTSVQYMPLQYRARQFSASHIEAMRALPRNIVLDGPAPQRVLVCHASPNDMVKSPARGIDAHMAQNLRAINADVIVVGHLHTAWHQYWEGKLLVMAGSAGLPYRGKPDEVDYLVLTYQLDGWQFRYKAVTYDCQAAIRDTLQSDMLEQSGPIGWLMLDEILTQEDRLLPFLRGYCPEKKPDGMEGWKQVVIGYLEHIKRWDVVKPYVQHLL